MLDLKVCCKVLSNLPSKLCDENLKPSTLFWDNMTNVAKKKPEGRALKRHCWQQKGLCEKVSCCLEGSQEALTKQGGKMLLEVRC